MLGYVEFVRDEWLRHLLTWQEESGCFKMPKEQLYTNRKLLVEEELPGMHYYITY